MKSAVVLWMILTATSAFAQSAPTAKAWDATSITWQNIYPDGTKWAVGKHITMRNTSTITEKLGGRRSSRTATVYLSRLWRVVNAQMIQARAG
jgi:hypothetical protein